MQLTHQLHVMQQITNALGGQTTMAKTDAEISIIVDDPEIVDSILELLSASDDYEFSVSVFGPIAEGEETPDDEPEPEDGEEVDFAALGEQADDGDEEATAALTEKAEEAGLDPDDFPTWAELAEALVEAAPAEDGERTEGYTEEELTEMSLADLKSLCEEYEIEVPRSKADRVAAILETQGGGAEEGETELTEDDLNAMSLADLKALAKENSVKTTPGMRKDAVIEAILEAMAE